LDLSNGTHNVLAASLNAALLAICIKVHINDTLSIQYFCWTYSITLNLWVSSKSISKSGMLIRAGLRNLSNSSPYGSGSISVILITRANKEPAPEPLPGQTTILFFLARRTKSETIKKYQLNHISLITLSSYSKRSMYAEIEKSKV